MRKQLNGKLTNLQKDLLAEVTTIAELSRRSHFYRRNARRGNMPLLLWRKAGIH